MKSNPDRADTPVMVPIAEIVQETAKVRTFYFDYELKSKPGQFVMLWIPGVDQKPFSIGGDEGDSFQLSIFELGKATQTLFKLKKGDKVGISGPYGTDYAWKPKQHVITVGGGYGAAPLAFLADRAAEEKCKIDFIVGARSREHLLFEKRAKKAGAKVHAATDDGSRGVKGFATDILDKILNDMSDRKRKDVVVCACGPELMQKKVAELGKTYGVATQISLERYMKCGFGICGNCCVDDDGFPTCQKGPVISGAKALRIIEFGKYHRDKQGIKHEF
ncbi:MAG: dihydroorotate dehydrogenase electron transfer subunit [Candidatus Kerfeldbacteria bacterium]